MSPPIDSLPTEVLASIFEILDQSIDRRRSDATAHSLLDAQLVCRYWHATIVATPSLWTTVWIGDWHSALLSGFSIEDEMQRPTVVNFLKRLERSGQTLPLDIIVHWEAPSEELLGVLQHTFNRWASITFLPGEEDDQVTVQSYFNVQLPNLHTLDIRLEVSFWNDELFIDTPQLRTLKCMTHLVSFLGAAPPLVHIDIRGEASQDPDQQYLAGMGVSLPLESLRLCKGTVEFLSLAANWEDEEGAPIDDEEMDIDFPRLHTLRLSEWTINAAIFLRRASFPALRTLHVGWMVDPDNPPDLPDPEDFSPFPPFPHLRELQWEGSEPEKLASLRVLLASTPNLQVLSDQDVLGPEGEGGALINALLDIAHPDTLTLCPMLRELHVQHASVDELDLLTAGNSRSALKIISVHTLVDVGVETEVTLKRVRERDVELRIGSGS